MDHELIRTSALTSIPLAVTVVAATLGALLAAILPTGLYLYVEPRGRSSWGTLDGSDTPATRRAPLLVRASAWMSFAVGQLALPWLLVPAACAVLLYVQTKLGIGRPIGLATTVGVGGMAAIQSLLALGLLPLGVRLLARDPKLVARLGRLAKTRTLASALLLLGASALGTMMTMPGLVHPWLRAALVWSALRPVAIYAAVGLVHALMLGRCAVVLENRSKAGG